jgi:hypothetical protein
MDWDRLLQLADDHGLSAILFRHLQSAPGTAPDEVLDRLRARVRLRALENLRLTSGLIDLVARFAEHHIDVLAFKGPVLSVQLFGDPATRDYDDIDLLVRPRDARRASKLLESRGFEPWFELSPDEEERLEASQYARHLGNPESGIAVDIHWGFAQPSLSFRIEEETLWRDTRTVTLGDAEVRTLSDRVLLLALCVHGSKHEPFPWKKLKWIVDVAGLLRDLDDRDAIALLHDARRLRLERPVLFGLAMARELLAAPLPEPVDRALARAGGLGGLTDATIGALTAVEEQQAPRMRYDLMLLDRRRDRVRYLLHRALVPNPKDWAFVRLPRRLAPLYYLVRPVRLLASALTRRR